MDRGMGQTDIFSVNGYTVDINPLLEMSLKLRRLK
jgi:hypothetical protein